MKRVNSPDEPSPRAERLRRRLQARTAPDTTANTRRSPTPTPTQSIANEATVTRTVSTSAPDDHALGCDAERRPIRTVSTVTQSTAAGDQQLNADSSTVNVTSDSVAGYPTRRPSSSDDNRGQLGIDPPIAPTQTPSDVVLSDCPMEDVPTRPSSSDDNRGQLGIDPPIAPTQTPSDVVLSDCPMEDVPTRPSSSDDNRGQLGIDPPIAPTQTPSDVVLSDCPMEDVPTRPSSSDDNRGQLGIDPPIAPTQTPSDVVLSDCPMEDVPTRPSSSDDNRGQLGIDPPIAPTQTPSDVVLSDCPMEDVPTRPSSSDDNRGQLGIDPPIAPTQTPSDVVLSDCPMEDVPTRPTTSTPMVSPVASPMACPESPILSDFQMRAAHAHSPAVDAHAVHATRGQTPPSIQGPSGHDGTFGQPQWNEQMVTTYILNGQQIMAVPLPIGPSPFPSSSDVYSSSFSITETLLDSSWEPPHLPQSVIDSISPAPDDSWRLTVEGVRNEVRRVYLELMRLDGQPIPPNLPPPEEARTKEKELSNQICPHGQRRCTHFEWMRCTHFDCLHSRMVRPSGTLASANVRTERPPQVVTNTSVGGENGVKAAARGKGSIGAIMPKREPLTKGARSTPSEMRPPVLCAHRRSEQKCPHARCMHARRMLTPRNTVTEVVSIDDDDTEPKTTNPDAGTGHEPITESSVFDTTTSLSAATVNDPGALDQVERSPSRNTEQGPRVANQHISGQNFVQSGSDEVVTNTSVGGENGVKAAARGKGSIGAIMPKREPLTKGARSTPSEMRPPPLCNHRRGRKECPHSRCVHTKRVTEENAHAVLVTIDDDNAELNATDPVESPARNTEQGPGVANQHSSDQNLVQSDSDEEEEAERNSEE